jgi:hypothetical protein
MTINPASTYTVELTQVNGGAPFNVTSDAMSVVSADLTGVNITVKVFTDNYPSETTWEIRNSATNALVASGGPYVGAGGTAAGGPDALQTKTHNVTLPAGSNCYKITMADGYGDGFGYGTNPAGQYGMEIVCNGASIINLDLGNFGTSFVRDAAMKTDASSSILEMLTNTFNVFPNPASDVVNVTFEADNADYTIAIVDLQGRTMSSQELSSLNGAQSIALPVSNLAKGSYIVTITSNGVSTSKNVVIK